VHGIAMGHFADRVPTCRVIVCGAALPDIAFLLLSRLNSAFELYSYHASPGLVGSAPPWRR
jgi:hypothetical protein